MSVHTAVIAEPITKDNLASGSITHETVIDSPEDLFRTKGKWWLIPVTLVAFFGAFFLLALAGAGALWAFVHLFSLNTAHDLRPYLVASMVGLVLILVVAACRAEDPLTAALEGLE